MFGPRRRGVRQGSPLWLLVALAPIAAACSSGTEPRGGAGPNNPLTSVRIAGGNGQVGLPGTTLPAPISILVLKNQTPVAGATVNFAVSGGNATLSPTTAVTGSDGQAATRVTLGTTPGAVTVTASIVGKDLFAVFTLGDGTTTGTPTPACQTTSAVTPSAGAVLTDLGGTGVCLGGGPNGADYALVAFYGNPDSSQSASLTVRSTGGAVSLASASRAPAFNIVPTRGAARQPVNHLQATFSTHLRDVARRELTSRIPAARTAAARIDAQQSPLLAAVPADPRIGSLITLNAQGTYACSNPVPVAARIVAVSKTAIVVADTANPANGFSTTEYQALATMFDTLIYPLDVQNFGTPSDIDGNGKIIIFFTKEVNKLTPRGSPGVVGGFFFERDLFPKTSTTYLQGCAGSNYAEMYYSLVPDPTGIYSDPRSKSSVQRLTPGTLAHEFQHLINAGRRIYVNNSDSFEDTWLNEGLSHIAEELLYYRVSGLSPRQNITTRDITRNQSSVDAFNNYQGDNVGRYEAFLGKPNETSVYAGNDSLETRGATWDMLRDLADHRSGTESDTWMALVNTALTGQQNLANVFGATYMTQIRDWATSVFADDLAGQSNLQFSQPSWDFRNIFPELVDGSDQPVGQYPLTVFPLSDASPVNVPVFAGAAAYIRFSVPANGNASIDWSSSGAPLPALMRFTVVRSN